MSRAATPEFPGATISYFQGLIYSRSAQFRTFPAIDREGQVGFTAVLQDPSSPVGESIAHYGERSGALTLTFGLLRQTPGGPEGETLLLPTRITYGTGGHVALVSYASVPGGGSTRGRSGIWLGFAGDDSVDLVLPILTPIGDPTFTISSGLVNGAPPLGVNRDGAIVVATTASFEGANPSTGSAGAIILSSADGEQRLLAGRGLSAAGLEPGESFSGYLPRPRIAANDQVYFEAGVTGPAGNRYAIFRGSRNDNLEILVASGTQAPGLADGTLFSQFGGSTNLGVNDLGQIAFRAWVTPADGSTTAGHSAVFGPSITGDLTALVKSGSLAPARAEGVTFAAFTDVVLSGGGDVAFTGLLAGNGIDETNNEGIWKHTIDAGLKLVAQQGDFAPGGASSPQLFGGLDAPVINSQGRVAFSAFTETGTEEPAPFADAIYAEDAQGVLQLVAGVGSTIDVSDNPNVTDLRTVRSVSRFTGTGNEDGLASVFNDRGELVFVAGFNDGTSGVFVWNGGAIPEPANLVTMTLLLVTLGSNLRRAT